MRINATPSDLPFKSTGFATYPVPPQFGQLSGATPLPLSVKGILTHLFIRFAEKYFALRITNKNFGETNTQEGDVSQAPISGQNVDFQIFDHVIALS
jgi:hypothetical protein